LFLLNVEHREDKSKREKLDLKILPHFVAFLQGFTLVHREVRCRIHKAENGRTLRSRAKTARTKKSATDSAQAAAGVSHAGKKQARLVGRRRWVFMRKDKALYLIESA
jgi:hypothetical protein